MSGSSPGKKEEILTRSLRKLNFVCPSSCGSVRLFSGLIKHLTSEAAPRIEAEADATAKEKPLFSFLIYKREKSGNYIGIERVGDELKSIPDHSGLTLSKNLN